MFRDTPDQIHSNPTVSCQRCVMPGSAFRRISWRRSQVTKSGDEVRDRCSSRFIGFLWTLDMCGSPHNQTLLFLAAACASRRQRWREMLNRSSWHPWHIVALCWVLTSGEFAKKSGVLLWFCYLIVRDNKNMTEDVHSTQSIDSLETAWTRAKSSTVP